MFVFEISVSVGSKRSIALRTQAGGLEHAAAVGQCDHLGSSLSTADLPRDQHVRHQNEDDRKEIQQDVGVERVNDVQLVIVETFCACLYDVMSNFRSKRVGRSYWRDPVPVQTV